MKKTALIQKLADFGRRSELSRFLFTFRTEFTYALGFTAVVNVLMLTPTLYMLQIFDRVMTSFSEYTLFAVTLMLFVFLGVMSFAEWVRSRLLVRLGVRLDMQLNPRIFRSAFELQNRGEEDSVRLFKNLSRLRQFLTGAGLFAILDTPWTPIYIAVLFLLHPWLGIMAIVFCLLLCGIGYITKRVLDEPLETADEARVKEARHLDARFRHAAAVESMGMLGSMRNAWMKSHIVALVQGRRGQDAQRRMQSISSFVRMLQQSMSLGLGAVLVIHNEISAGAMIAANVLMTRATHPMDALMRAWQDVVAAKKAFLDLETVLEVCPEREEAALEETTPGMAVRLEKIFAMAEGRAQPILDGVSLKIPAGLSLGVRGPSGSGKSTLARALLGIWPEMRGEVFYDDVPIRGMNRTMLGASLGYLPQDVELFEGTIAENVARFGKINSDLVIEACSQAGVHEMILRFPNGYDTFIGDGGSFLSGGQRQRIGLARAIYGNPRLVILDEPNSSLDEAGDRALLQTVKALKERGTTLVLISHRPQIMEAMDIILVVEEGRAVRLETPRQSEQPTNSTAVTTPAGNSAKGRLGAPQSPSLPSGTSSGAEPKPPRRSMFMPV